MFLASLDGDEASSGAILQERRVRELSARLTQSPDLATRAWHVSESFQRLGGGQCSRTATGSFFQSSGLRVN